MGLFGCSHKDVKNFVNDLNLPIKECCKCGQLFLVEKQIILTKISIKDLEKYRNSKKS
jgi:hypothetical protein